MVDNIETEIRRQEARDSLAAVAAELQKIETYRQEIRAKRDAAILDARRILGERSVSEIASIAGVTRQTVYDALDRIKERERCVRVAEVLEFGTTGIQGL